MRPLDPDLIDPTQTAVVTMEMQRGIVGEGALMPALADAVRGSATIERIADLLGAARHRGVAVVHATVSHRPGVPSDRATAPVLAQAAGAQSHHLASGTESAQVVPQLFAATDVVVERNHGVTPFTGTALDATLRALRVETIVLVGVSVNMGILGATMEAIGNGYSVVVPTDAVAGVPASYAHDVIRNSLRLLAWLSTVDEVVTRWSHSEIEVGEQ
jgi:nicotinamidase-related amidase